MTGFSARILADTGFWIALFYQRDERHVEARSCNELLETREIIVPWPSLYETVNTRLVKNRPALSGFETLLGSPRCHRITDEKYREDALRLTFDTGVRGHRPLSLVDMVIRMILDDDEVQVNGLLTFNRGDFVDVCQSRRIELLPQTV